MKLTVKQKAFADEYVKSGNAKQSAIKAGYSEKTAKSIGQENLTKPDLKKYIAEKMAKLDEERTMSAKEAIEFLTRVVRGEETETVVVATVSGYEKTKKEADLKTRIQATKEILKRYPGSDEVAKQQLRKLTAEADIAEANASMVGNQTGRVTITLDNFEDSDED
ncbi:terminase small subunit [Eupransor demetentiae]|uniref:Small subunit (XtmA) n=1 Tax=Eupransor demetentiae TaxID=3109584 RepID=A0ABM9N4N0_9LACO|nr:Phage terminase [Lactobacillaceae bacterium LMG 33000]